MSASPKSPKSPKPAGSGGARSGALQRLGLRNDWDIALHLPLRYEDRTRVVPIGALSPGMRVAVEGEVQLTEVVYRRRRQLLRRLLRRRGPWNR